MHVKNLNILNVVTAHGMIKISDANFIRVENNDLRWSGHAAISVRNNSDNGWMLNNRIHESGNGIALNGGAQSHQ